MPTSNFFQRGGYERNDVASLNNTVAKLFAATNAQIAAEAELEGAEELAAAFDAVEVKFVGPRNCYAVGRPLRAEDRFQIALSATIGATPVVAVSRGPSFGSPRRPYAFVRKYAP